VSHVTLNDHVEKERHMRTLLGVFGIVAIVTATAQPIGAQGNSRRQSRQEQQELGSGRPGLRDARLSKLILRQGSLASTVMSLRLWAACQRCQNLMLLFAKVSIRATIVRELDGRVPS
jgi:hypothetical protein